MNLTEEQKLIVQRYKEIQNEFNSIKGTMNLLKSRAKELMFELESLRSNETELLEKLEKK
jgi:hypothetical protein